MKVNPIKLGIAGGIVAAASMLLLSILNAFGLYTGAAEQMTEWHMFYSPDALGTLTGMLEAAIITYVSLYAVAYMYDLLLRKSGTA